MKIRKVAEKIFKDETPQNGGEGLFVSVEELVAQRRYAYQWQLNRLNRASSRQAGDVKSVFKGRGMEFEEIRSYAYGDDVRDIDWRVTARKQVPYTKLYAEERDREVYVLLDLSPQMLFGSKKELKAVTAAKITARIGWQCLKNKDRFGCLLSDGKDSVLLKAQNTQANMMLIFKRISDTSRHILQRDVSAPENYLEKSMSLLLKTVKSRAIVFVVSDFSEFGPETQKILAMLAKKTDVTCVNVFDKLEKCPPVAGEYMAQKGSEKVVFSSEGASFRKTYVAYFAEKHNEVKEFCCHFKINYLENGETLSCV